jgi:hypothetical protein
MFIKFKTSRSSGQSLLVQFHNDLLSTLPWIKAELTAEGL